MVVSLKNLKASIIRDAPSKHGMAESHDSDAGGSARSFDISHRSQRHATEAIQESPAAGQTPEPHRLPQQDARADPSSRPNTRAKPATAPGRKGKFPQIAQHDRDQRDDDKKHKRQETAHPGQSFACPFAKSDPVEHISCLKYQMKRIGDVKNHILRYHMMPVHCPTCGLEFKKAGRQKHDDRANHVRGRKCIVADFQFPPGLLSPEQMDGLKECGEDSSQRGSKYERRWYALWTFLVNGSAAPSTPYAGSEFQERMEIAAANVANNHQIREAVNRFAYGQQTEAENLVNSVVRLFRTFADGEKDARATYTSLRGSSPLQPVLAPTPRGSFTLPIEHNDAGYGDVLHTLVGSQPGAFTWDYWQPNLEPELGIPGGDYLTPNVSSTAPDSILPARLFGNDGPTESSYGGDERPNSSWPGPGHLPPSF
ncbi:hypothetical protein QBC34DRAFT_384253 [Podospora aff. communis PSN243]|uniref:C2H2-type domain-containing protein n=1 Tax=Podospora aff. communis PSN243 TaxID=3040156 RepID=A0AAV9GBD8_9PEZI|nr:hypothetical protein QBC34DRAFT_384253 [Podospora aff. communis PSN243]